MVGFTDYEEDEAHPEITNHLVLIVLELHRVDAARGFIAHHQARIDAHLPSSGQFNADLGISSNHVKHHATEMAKHAAELVEYERSLLDHWREIRKLVASDVDRLNMPPDSLSHLMQQFTERIDEMVQNAHREMAGDE